MMTKSCKHRHTMGRTTTACLWPGATFIGGQGMWALVSACPSRHHGGRWRTVSLHPTHEAAEGVRVFLDQMRCGHACVGRHYIVLIATTNQQGAART